MYSCEEGKVPPLVFILLQKLGGRVEITDEDLRQYNGSKYVLRTWYDNARAINMYELVDNTTVDGEVVPDGSHSEDDGQRAIGSGGSGPGRHDGVGDVRC